MGTVFRDIADNWHVYATMPVIAALIGYITKRAAIEMMYRPLEFVGIRPFLGWHGVIPRNAHRMSSVAMELMTTNLIEPKEIFARLDPKRITDELREPLARAVDQIIHEIMTTYQATAWELLPPQAQRLVINRVRAQAPRVIEKLMREVAENVEEYLDVRDMAVTNLVRDKAVLNKLIRDTAKPEMRFIAHSGIYFGSVIGLVQVVAWALHATTSFLGAGEPRRLVPRRQGSVHGSLRKLRSRTARGSCRSSAGSPAG